MNLRSRLMQPAHGATRLTGLTGLLSGHDDSFLLAGLGLAVAARAVLAGSDGAASRRAALCFVACAAALVWASGWRPGRARARSVLTGLAGAGVLIAGPALRPMPVPPVAGVAQGRLAAWVVLVSAVAVAEELLLRGALWQALERRHGPLAALAVTTLAFGVMHAPLYGWHAVPLDLAVGLLLGGLRLWTGGVAAPAAAHLVADVAGGWL